MVGYGCPASPASPPRQPATPASPGWRSSLGGHRLTSTGPGWPRLEVIAWRSSADLDWPRLAPAGGHRLEVIG